MGMFIKYQPIKDKDELSISWIVDYTGEDHTTKPLEYFSHLFGHEGPNSLLSYLKKEGLGIELSSGADHELWGLSSFDVSVTLTKKGLQEYQRVLDAIFKYAQVLKEAGPQEYIFNEVKRLGEIRFNFMSKGKPASTVSGYANRMAKFNNEEIDKLISSQYLVESLSEKI